MESIGDPQTVDPAWAYDTASASLIFNIYDTLVFFDRESVSDFVPSIATDWWINQPPIGPAPYDNSTWYFRIRGTSGTHTMESTVEVPAGNPISTLWHELSPWYSKIWHIWEWIDNGDGVLSASDIIKMDRACQNWDGETPMPVDTWQTFHVDEVIGTLPGYVDIVVTELPVKFHDGSDLTAADVEYSFERAMVQDRSGGPVWMLNEPLFGDGWPDKTAWPEDASCPINLVVESNSTHVWLNLAMPYPPFMQILSQSWASIVSQAWCTAQGDWDGDWTDWLAYLDPPISPLDDPDPVMMGTGPYEFDYWTAGVEWSIIRFVDHWQQWPAPGIPWYLDRYTEKVVYEWGTRKADLLGGVADTVYVPRAYLPEMVENWPVKWNPEPGVPPPYEWNPETYAAGIRCLPGIPTLQEANYFFNFDINPATTRCGSKALDGNGIPLDFFADINIRRAFAYSFNYTGFLEDMFWGEAEQPSSCVPSGVAYHIDVEKFTYDLELARDYFIAANNTVGGSAEGVCEIGFKMTITFNTGNIPRETTCYMLKEGVEEVFSTYFSGPVTISVESVPWPTYLGELVGYPTFKSLMAIFVIGWLADYPDPHNWVVPYMRTYGDFSGFQSYSNATVDALIDEGIATPDGPARQAIYETLQLMYFQDCPSVATSQALGRHWETEFYMGWYYNPIYPGIYVKHIYKGLNGDINGDQRVEILDDGVLSSHWYPGPPVGERGYHSRADIIPENQYIDIPKVWDADLMAWIPHPSIGAVDIFDSAKISNHFWERVSGT